MNMNEFITKALVTGAFASKGEFEKGGEKVVYDNICFYTQMPLTRGKGYATVEHKMKNRSDDFEVLFGVVELPAMAQITFTELTDGKGKMVREVVAIEFAKPEKKANANQ